MTVIENLKRKIYVFYNYNTNRINRLVIIVIGTIIALGIFSVINKIHSRSKYYSQLNDTVNEITQLIDNIRMIYHIHENDNLSDIISLLNKHNVLPPDMYKNGLLYNAYDGNIIIEPAADFINKNTVHKTFKISYQKIPYQICKDLFIINWGSPENGYLGAAGGIIYSDGSDTALFDIDAPTDEDKIIKTHDENGKEVLIKKHAKYKMNIAKPNLTPADINYNREQAETACKCKDKGDICSFALRYIAM